MHDSATLRVVFDTCCFDYKLKCKKGPPLEPDSDFMLSDGVRESGGMTRVLRLQCFKVKEHSNN